MSHMDTFGRRKAPVETAPAAAPEAATAAAPEAATAAAPEAATPRKRKHKATPTVSPFPESHDSEWQ
jgi:peptidoglycan hydrolase CwlO-like protein